MPKYIFTCHDCGEDIEFQVSFKDIDTFKPICPDKDCLNDKLIRNYSAEIESQYHSVKKDKLQPIYVRRGDKDCKKKKAALVDAQIAEEPFESKTEILESQDIASEYEKLTGKTPGSLSGKGVKAVKTKEEKAKIKERDLKKKNEAVRMRRKAGF